MLTTFILPVAFVAGIVIPHSEVLTRGYVDNRADFIQLDPCAAATVTGNWKLSWDDEVGQELVGDLKTCDLSLHSIEDQVSGTFSGPVAGRERDAIIRGRLYCQPRGKLLLLQQCETGYICSYQIFWDNNAADQSKALGVWHDTAGRSGNFTLLRHQ